jgi:hypothetical protein
MPLKVASKKPPKHTHHKDGRHQHHHHKHPKKEEAVELDEIQEEELDEEEYDPEEEEYSIRSPRESVHHHYHHHHPNQPPQQQYMHHMQYTPQFAYTPVYVAPQPDAFDDPCTYWCGCHAICDPQWCTTPGDWLWWGLCCPIPLIVMLGRH